MHGLGKGGGGGHHGGGGGGHHGGGGHRGGSRGAYFAPGYGWGYPYPYDDSYPLQVVVPDSCEESVRAGCYQRWSHDPARMAKCISDGYRGCGGSGLGALPVGAAYTAMSIGAGALVGLAGAVLLKKNKAAGAGIGAALAGGYLYGAKRGWFPFRT